MRKDPVAEWRVIYQTTISSITQHFREIFTVVLLSFDYYFFCRIWKCVLSTSIEQADDWANTLIDSVHLLYIDMYLLLY